MDVVYKNLENRIVYKRTDLMLETNKYYINKKFNYSKDKER